MKIEYNIEHLLERNGLYNKKFSDEIVSGEVFQMFGDIKVPLGVMKGGKKDVKWSKCYKNRQKKEETTYKFGEEISSKEWNEDGSLDE